MSQRVVLVRAQGTVPAGVHLLVGSLARFCVVRAQDLSPTAVLVVGRPAGIPAGLPVALWCAAPEDARGPLADRAVALLHDGALDGPLDRASDAAPDGAPADQPDHRILRISPRVDGLSDAALSTALRARLRGARGLPDAPVLTRAPDGWRWQGRLLTGPEVDTALACAAAVVVTDPTDLLRALSWGAPVVTSATAAREVGVTAGVEVLVVTEPDARLAAAHTLAADEVLAARLGRAGRQHVERRHDLDRSMTRLALALRLEPGHQRTARTSLLLDSLSTPREAAIRGRVALALAPLSQLPPEVAVLPAALSVPATQALAPAAGPSPAPGPVAVPGPGQTARRIAKGVLRRLVGAGLAQLMAELRANRTELARLRAEVDALRSTAANLASPEALAARVELLQAQVDQLVAAGTTPAG